MAESLVTLIGIGPGTGAGLQVVELSCFKKSLWDAQADFTVFMDGNGSELAANTAVSITSDNSYATTANVPDIAAFGSIINEMYVNLVNPVGSNVPIGLYEIISHTNDVLVIDVNGVNGSDVIIGDDTVDYGVGGVRLATTGLELQDALDAIAEDVNGTVNNIDILDNKDSITITATIDIANISGSISTRVRIIGTNSVFVEDGTRIEITTTSTLTNGLLFFNNTSDNTTWRNVNFNAGGKASSRAAYGVRNTATGSLSHSFIRCNFFGASVTGMANRSSSWSFTGCNFNDNGLYGSGVAAGGTSDTYYSCSFSNNVSHGAFIGGQRTILINCLFIDNGGDGVFAAYINTRQTYIMKCNISRNTGNGISFIPANNFVTISNTTISFNTGFGIDTDGADIHYITLTNNHSHFNNSNNETGNVDILSSSSQWVKYGDGSNIIGDPLFTDPDNGDFTLQSSSPLREAGVGGTDIGALQFNGAGGGGATGVSKSRIFGGI